VGDELPEERPYRGDMGIRVVGEVDAEVARSTRAAQPVQRLLVDAERGQVPEQQAIATAQQRSVEPFGRQAMVSGDARGVPAHRCAFLSSLSHTVTETGHPTGDWAPD
jgi:hypothetical protein